MEVYGSTFDLVGTMRSKIKLILFNNPGMALTKKINKYQYENPYIQVTLLLTKQ